MGKSLKNSVSPDEVCLSYGADTLRMYEMAMGPVDANRPWRRRDIVGAHRFLQRLWRTIVDEETGEVRPAARNRARTTDCARSPRPPSATSPAPSMTCASTRQVAEALVLMVFPLAPHVAAELWERLGHHELIDDMPFPAPSPGAFREESATIPVTVDGRPRETITIDRAAAEGEAVAAGLRLATVAAALAGREVARVVYVPGTILNLVTRGSG
jgi:leucyl-tRNA synthetase